MPRHPRARFRISLWHEDEWNLEFVHATAYVVSDYNFSVLLVGIQSLTHLFVVDRMAICRAVVLIATVLMAGCNRLETLSGPCRFEEKATLPVVFRAGLPVVPATIDGQAVNLIVDTGAEVTTVTPEAATHLHLDTDNFHAFSAAGVTDVTHVQAVYIYHFGLGAIDLGRHTVPAIGFGAPVDPKADNAVSGLLGADILSRFDLDLDLGARRLTLYDPHGCLDLAKLPWTFPYASVASHLTDEKRFAIPVDLEGHQFTALFDTGASRTIFSAQAAGQLGVTPDILQRDPSITTFGVGGKPRSVPVHPFSRLTIGDTVTSNVKLPVANFVSLERDMLIGEDFMRTHRLWFSYTTGLIAIQNQPNVSAVAPAP